MYVSTEFKQLRGDNETIGKIKFNHWTLYKDYLLDYNYNDTMLEVRDKQDKIVFSLKYGSTPQSFRDDMKKMEIYLKRDPANQDKTPISFKNAVLVKGYFVGDSVVTVINDRDSFTPILCIPQSLSDWQQRAAIEISKIKSIF